MSSVQYYPGYSQVQVNYNLTWQQIASITQTNPMVLTTVNNHIYPAGLNVAFRIPLTFGMQQLNNLNGEILSVTNNTMTIAIDSTQFTPFAIPSPVPPAIPTVYANASAPYLPPLPLPYGNQDSFEGVIYNNGTPGNLINQV